MPFPSKPLTDMLQRSAWMDLHVQHPTYDPENPCLYFHRHLDHSVDVTCRWRMSPDHAQVLCNTVKAVLYTPQSVGLFPVPTDAEIVAHAIELLPTLGVDELLRIANTATALIADAAKVTTPEQADT